MFNSLNKIAPSWSEKLLLGLTGTAWIVSFAYYTPEQTQALFNMIGWKLQPSFDMPSLFVLILIAWVLYVIIQYAIIQLKRTSDYVIAEGMDHAESCIGAELIKVGYLGILRVNGTKAIPIRGSSVWINPLTHIHRIGTHIVMTAQMTPNTSLMNVPFETKPHVRQRRFDLLGIKDSSVGYLTSQELDLHKEFKKDEFDELKEYLQQDEKNLTAPINTITFINAITTSNRMYDTQLQSNEFENKAITDHLETQAGIGKAVRKPHEKGIFQQLGLG